MQTCGIEPYSTPSNEAVSLVCFHCPSAYQNRGGASSLDDCDCNVLFFHIVTLNYLYMLMNIITPFRLPVPNPLIRRAKVMPVCDWLLLHCNTTLSTIATL